MKFFAIFVYIINIIVYRPTTTTVLLQPSANIVIVVSDLPPLVKSILVPFSSSGIVLASSIASDSLSSSSKMVASDSPSLTKLVLKESLPQPSINKGIETIIFEPPLYPIAYTKLVKTLHSTRFLPRTTNIYTTPLLLNSPSSVNTNSKESSFYNQPSQGNPYFTSINIKSNTTLTPSFTIHTLKNVTSKKLQSTETFSKLHMGNNTEISPSTREFNSSIKVIDSRRPPSQMIKRPSAAVLRKQEHFERMIRIEYYLRSISYSFVWISIILLFNLRDTMVMLFHDDLRWRLLHNRPLCVAGAIVYHYFATTIYTCMLVEGIHICIKLKTVFEVSSRRKRHFLYLVIAWGFPLVSTGITVGVWYEDFKNTNTCYSLPDKDKWKWKGPILIILILNILCFVYIIFVVVRKVFSKNNNNANYQKIGATLRSLSAIVPLLGITFLLGFFIQYKFEILGYVFVVANGILGFLFFVFHILLDKQVRVQFARQVLGKKDFISVTNLKDGSPRSQTLAKTKYQLTNMRTIISQAKNTEKVVEGKTNPSLSIAEACNGVNITPVQSNAPSPIYSFVSDTF